MWIPLTELEQLDFIKQNSISKPQLIFKHSTRCSISHMAKHRLDSALEKLKTKYDLFYLDLLSYRNISNAVAELFNEFHESPQVLVISNQECIINLTHNEISSDELM